MAAEKFTEFDYLLNALELASQSARPSQEGYGDKRLAMFQHVRELERKANAFDGAIAQIEACDSRAALQLAEVGLANAASYEGRPMPKHEVASINAALKAVRAALGVETPREGQP